MSDLGKKTRVFETDKPVIAPNFVPVKKESEVEVEHELVTIRRSVE